MIKYRLKNLRIKQKAIMRKRRRSNRIRKRHNIKKRKKTAKSKQEPYNPFKPRPYEAIAPNDFSISNIEGALAFINKTENACKRGSRITFLKINLDNVKKIDSYALSLLLSLLNKISCLNIRYWGTYPDDPLAKQFILDSGFLDLVKTNIKKPSNNRVGNQIYMVGKDFVDSHLIGAAVRESMQHITGKVEPYSPVYDDLLEISANSVEHANANKSDKNWLVSISLENNKIHYVVTDTGAGILATLRKKATQQLRDTFFKGDAEVLHDVFMKLYQSITGEINRHKGLPIILESFTDGFISDLQVLTNKVYYDFGTNTPKELKKGFNGVMYSWTVSLYNYNNWLNSL